MLTRSRHAFAALAAFVFLYAALEKLSISLTILRGSIRFNLDGRGRFNRQVIDFQ
jgi:hypothetical protein